MLADHREVAERPEGPARTLDRTRRDGRAELPLEPLERLRRRVAPSRPIPGLLLLLAGKLDQEVGHRARRDRRKIAGVSASISGSPSIGLSATPNIPQRRISAEAGIAGEARAGTR